MAERDDVDRESGGAPADACAIAPTIDKVEAPAIAPAVDAVVSPTPTSEMRNVELAPASAPKPDTPTAELPKVDAPRTAAIGAAQVQSDKPKVGPLKADKPMLPPRKQAVPARTNRFPLLAASVALAAAVGAVAGAFGASAVVHMNVPARTVAPASTSRDTAALQATIGKLRSEVASLRASVDAANKSAHGQFGKIAERFDRIERSETDRSGKLAKALQAIEKLDRRADVAPAPQTTGSITPPAPAPAAAAAAAAPAELQPPIVPGWAVRDVYRGVAILQGRRIGLVEVERGDVIPGVGRIESIKRQDGHWVVVTSKGIITSMR
jgi:hypothetical protein